MVNKTSVEKLNFCIITPNYNMGKYLEKTIESVLLNIEDGDEYYIIDGGSTDNSLDIIKKYENKITGWISEPDNGYAEALYKGFNMTKSPLMCWINSGDLLLINSLKIMRQIFKNNDIDMLYSDDYYINEMDCIIQHSNGSIINLKKSMLYGGWTPLQDACFWRRSLYEKCKRINPKYLYAADFDLFLKMVLMGRPLYVDAVVSAFRKHDSQKSVANKKQYAIEKKKIIEKTIKCTSNNSILLKTLNTLLYTNIVRIRCRLFFLNKKKSRYLGKNVTFVEARFGKKY